MNAITHRIERDLATIAPALLVAPNVLFLGSMLTCCIRVL